MATRFYLPSSTASPYVPSSLSSVWDVQAGFVSRGTDVVKSNSALTNIVQTKDSTVAADDRIDRVYVSVRQLAAQTIAAGTFSMVVRTLESATTADFMLQVVIRVMTGDGATQRGVIYGGSAAAAVSATVGVENQEYASTAATRIKSAIATSSVVAQAGDRLQIEVGGRGFSTTTTHSFTHRWGDPSATADFALTAALTTDLCPWIELSNDLLWLAGTSENVTVSNQALIRAAYR